MTEDVFIMCICFDLNTSFTKSSCAVFFFLWLHVQLHVLELRKNILYFKLHVNDSLPSHSCLSLCFRVGGRRTNGTAALWYLTQFAVVYPDQPRSVEMVWKQEASVLSFGEPNILSLTHVAGCYISGPSLNLLSFHSPCLMRPKRPFRATPPTSK